MKKKQTRFLFSLLMAVVVMAMSPAKVWADRHLVATTDCELCNGTQKISCGVCNSNELGIECYYCNGDGTFDCTECSGTGIIYESCSSCGGSGWYDEDECSSCSGSGSQEMQCGACNNGMRYCSHCNEGYISCPFCDDENKYACPACVYPSEGSGTSESPYVIASYEEYAWLKYQADRDANANVTTYVKFGRDFDFTPYKDDSHQLQFQYGTWHIDLNGKVIKLRKAAVMIAGASVTFCDNSEEKTGAIVGTRTNIESGVGLRYIAGALTVDGGKYGGDSWGLKIDPSTSTLDDDAIALHGGEFDKISVANTAYWGKLGMTDYVFVEGCGFIVPAPSDADALNKTVRVVEASQQAVSHTLIKTEKADATCIAAGNTPYWSCSGCGKYFNEEATTEIEDGSWVTPATGHAYVEDDENHKVTCSHTGCTLEALILTEGANTGLTYAETSGPKDDASGYTTLYYFKAPGTGTLTVTDSDGNGNTEDTYGALFNADMSVRLAYNDDGIGNSYGFKFSYDVTEGEVYWIGARAYSGSTSFSNHTLTVSGTWPHPMASASLTDGEAYDGSLAHYKVETFTYTRSFEGTNWTTWYVPFELTLTDDICQKYAFSRISNVHQYDDDDDGTADRTVIESFRQSSGVTLKANYPYLVKALTDADKEMQLTLQDVNFVNADEKSIDCESVDYTYTFKGTYTGLSYSTASTEYSLFDDDEYGWERFKTLPAQRHCLTITPRSSGARNAPRRIELKVMGDEDATGIEELRGESLEVREGKYLENGRIVIVKNGKKYNTSGQVLR